MRKRTLATWKTYLRKLPNTELDHLARKWGMNTIAHSNNKYNSKDQRIELLLIHLDVMGKITGGSDWAPFREEKNWAFGPWRFQHRRRKTTHTNWSNSGSVATHYSVVVELSYRLRPFRLGLRPPGYPAFGTWITCWIWISVTNFFVRPTLTMIVVLAASLHTTAIVINTQLLK